MSTYNYPDATNVAPNVAPQAPKKDYRNIVYVLLTTGLLGSLGYIWLSKKSEKENDQKQEQQLVAVTNKADDNEQNYQAALVRLDSITNLNTSLNGEITNKDGTIATLKNQIEDQLRTIKASGKVTEQQKMNLQNKIDALNKEINNYKNRVAELEQQNQQLTVENTTVKTERDQVITERDQVKTDLDNTKTVKKQLEEKIDVGTTLVANNFNITGVNEKRNGKEKTTSTAKRVDKLRIGFDLDVNRITPTGKQKIYITITAPDGTPVTVEALGSGKMTTRNDGEKPFTTSMDVDYVQGEKKNINFDWKQNSDFQRGDYKVEVYQNGFKIGEGKVSLKKGGLFG
jgi:hypothetical protein